MNLGLLEAFKLAVKLEKNGSEFYEKMKDMVKDEYVKELLELLVQEEQEHIRVFEEIADQYNIEEHKKHYADSDDVDAYLDASLGAGIFKEEDIGKLECEGICFKEILDIAVESEKETIEYYDNMIAKTEGEIKEALTKINEEEKSHLEKLKNLRNKL